MWRLCQARYQKELDCEEFARILPGEVEKYDKQLVRNVESIFFEDCDDSNPTTLEAETML